jgi:hypothetical protein
MVTLNKQLFTDFVEVLTKHKITIGLEKTNAPEDDGIPLDKREHQPGYDGFVSRDIHEEIVAEKDEDIYNLRAKKSHMLNKIAEYQKVLAEIMHAVGMDRGTELKDFPRVMFASLGYGYDDFDNEGRLLIDEDERDDVPLARTLRRGLREKAVEKGAEERHVTREGYTKLPEIMINDLGFENDGGMLWFARVKKRWEAWPEDELSEYFKGVDEQSYQITVNPDGVFDRSAVKTNLENLITWIGNIRKKVNWTDAHTDEVAKRLQDILEKVS